MAHLVTWICVIECVVHGIIGLMDISPMFNLLGSMFGGGGVTLLYLLGTHKTQGVFKGCIILEKENIVDPTIM
jgi:hypothetical protein